MQNVRDNCIIWAQSTFEETLLNTNDISSQVSADSLRCFNNLEISGKRVNGYACEGLPKTEEGHTGVNINYTDVFHELNELGIFSPVRYLAELVSRHKDEGGSENRLEGFVSRGLRTLTSLLREPDFAESIVQYMSSVKQPAEIMLNPKQDARDHTDVLLTYRGDTYRIWLFQLSDRGLPHDIERVTGRRGELPSGIHVLCPLRTAYAIEHERIENKYQRTVRRIKDIGEELDSYSERAVKTREHLTDRLVTLNNEKKELEREFGKTAARTALELDIVEGWYFYSAAYVKLIGEMVCANVKPRAYEEVVSILTAAEKFLSEPRIFEKSN